MKHPTPSIRRREFLSRAGVGLAASTAGASLTALGADKASSGKDGVSITDFERSCLRFRIDTKKKAPKTVSRKLPMTLNNVRMLLDARAVITHKSSGRVHDLVLTSSCKSEQVWVNRDIWHQPNADMLMLASRDEFLVYKRWDKADKGVMLYPPSLGVQPGEAAGTRAGQRRCDPRCVVHRHARGGPDGVRRIGLPRAAGVSGEGR
jgi:hypothetical protein